MLRRPASNPRDYRRKRRSRASSVRYNLCRSHHTAEHRVLHCCLAVLLTATLSHGAQGGEPLRGYGAVEGAVGFSSGSLLGKAGITPGWQFEFGVGPRVLPLTLGVAMGEWFLQNENSAASVYSVDVRHVDLVLRLEPDWRWVRPFVSASVGVAALYLTPTGDFGHEDAEQQDLALNRGLSLGVDLELWGRRRNGENGTGALTLTLGVRGSETGPLFYLPYAAESVGSRGGSFGTRAPFVAVTLAGWS